MKPSKPLTQIRQEYNYLLAVKFWMEDCLKVYDKRGKKAISIRGQILIVTDKLKRIDLVREQTRISPFELKKIEL